VSIHPPIYESTVPSRSWFLRFASMYSVNLSAARSSLARKKSSITPGHVLRGAYWNYRVLEPVKGDNTHTSTVFKAQVIAHNARAVPEVPEWFVILTISRLF
jgi:hypothetical protein